MFFNWSFYECCFDWFWIISGIVWIEVLCGWCYDLIIGNVFVFDLYLVIECVVCGFY